MDEKKAAYERLYDFFHSFTSNKEFDISNETILQNLKDLNLLYDGSSNDEKRKKVSG